MSNYRTTACVMCLILGVWSVAPNWSAAQTDAEQALDSFPRNSWYDRETKQFIPPRIQPADDSPWRTEGRLGTQPAAPAQRSFFDGSWGDWFPQMPDLAGLATWIPRVLFALLGVALIIVIGSLTYYSLRNYLPRRFQPTTSTTAIEIDPARVVDLPFQVQAVDSHPLAEAERLMQAGSYDGAIVFLYGYLLLALDQARKIHLQRGKTNRMYLRELGGEIGLREIVYRTMLRFEDCYFGKHSVSQEQFLEVWRQVDDFHRCLEPTRNADTRAQIAAEGSL